MVFIIQNLLDIEKCGDIQNYLFLAGSAINTIKDEKGNYNPSVGAEAMQQIVAIYNEGFFKIINDCTIENLNAAAKQREFDSLIRALEQRYGKQG